MVATTLHLLGLPIKFSKIAWDKADPERCKMSAVSEMSRNNACYLTPTCGGISISSELIKQNQRSTMFTLVSALNEGRHGVQLCHERALSLGDVLVISELD